MRHQNKHRKFGRVRKVRRGLMRSLTEALFLRGRITTTEAKARELRPLAERMVTYGKRDSVASRRLVTSRLGGRKATTEKIFSLAKRYAGRNGGYTRIMKLPRRGSDGAPMAIIELVQ